MALVIAFFIGSVSDKYQQKEEEKESVPEKVMQIYNGTLPCADCGGIQTEISFVRETNSNEIKGKFNLQEVYIGKSKTPFYTEGEWSARVSSLGKTIITINTDKPKSEQKEFLLESESILMLDQDGNEIESSLNYRLNRL